MPRGEYLCDSEYNPYYDEWAESGQEVSSTGGGRHVSVVEGWLYHYDQGDGFVNKGQPVAFANGIGTAVGIALKDASDQYDVIPIDTEGIWRLEVWATDDIAPGQIMWLCDDGSGTSGIVTDDPYVSSGLPWVLGYAMEPFTFTSNGEFNVVVMAVKVHWMFWWWLFDGNGV